jgi:MFS family permease
LKSKTIGLAIGGLLIIIAIILGALQLANYPNFSSMWGWRHLYVYGLFGIIGLIGIIIAAWALMKKETPKTTKPTATTATSTAQ